ncbi:neprilysin-11-like [Dermacentor variabilis]|uniref:neprilysin-11-like n=1 Tax=Dermacentor variabilis TaxID=34621 RepID=UPI003F5C5941
MATASEFLSGINYSVDPCYDFESFACTGARQSPNLATRRRHFSNPWLAQFDNAAKYLQEVADTNTTKVVERIRAVLRRIGLPWWPMLEVEDHLNLFDVLRESFLHLGITGLFELRVRRDLQFGQPGHTRPYSFHIGPPKLYLPEEFLLLRKEDTPVFRQYEDRVTDVFRAFRKRVELAGIAREIIRLQYYLSKMFRLKPTPQDYYIGSVPLQNLSARDSLTDWHYFLADFYGDRDNYSVRDAAVNIWNMAYLEYLTRLFSDPYNKRALVNYLGWLMVDSLGHIAFKHQPNFYHTGGDVISTRNTVETCARLAMKMAPATSARIVFQATSYRRACVYVLRIAHELRETFLGQVRWLGWMDRETKEVAMRKIKAMKIEISDGETSDDGVVDVWHDDFPFAGIELNFRRNATAKLLKWLLRNDTGDDCKGHGYITPFSTNVHYLHWCNKLVIPIVMIHNATMLTELPPVYAFSTIGAMISIKFMEAIVFTGFRARAINLHPCRYVSPRPKQKLQVSSTQRLMKKPSPSTADKHAIE